MVIALSRPDVRSLGPAVHLPPLSVSNHLPAAVDEHEAAGVFNFFVIFVIFFSTATDLE